jgi:hypothetical protein
MTSLGDHLRNLASKQDLHTRFGNNFNKLIKPLCEEAAKNKKYSISIRWESIMDSFDGELQLLVKYINTLGVECDSYTGSDYHTESEKYNLYISWDYTKKTNYF